MSFPHCLHRASVSPSYVISSTTSPDACLHQTRFHQVFIVFSMAPNKSLKSEPRHEALLVAERPCSGGAALALSIDTGAIGDHGPSAMITSVTWDGHDFLDATKDNTVWEKAKKKILSPGLSFSFDLLKDLLVLGAKGPLGLP